jgi:hypothetical protein
MKKLPLLLLLVCLWSTTLAQPLYSPGERARRDKEWVTDSLHVTPEQAEKIYNISLDYNQKKDVAAQNPKQKQKKWALLMRKKDAAVKSVLNNEEQYKKYMRREKEIRRRESIIYKGPHQPL